MNEDPIVAEVRRARNEHAAQFNYDLDAICRDIKEREHVSGRKYVRYLPRAVVAQESHLPMAAKSK